MTLGWFSWYLVFIFSFLIWWTLDAHPSCKKTTVNRSKTVRDWLNVKPWWDNLYLTDSTSGEGSIKGYFLHILAQYHLRVHQCLVCFVWKYLADEITVKQSTVEKTNGNTTKLQKGVKTLADTNQVKAVNSPSSQTYTAISETHGSLVLRPRESLLCGNIQHDRITKTFVIWCNVLEEILTEHFDIQNETCFKTAFLTPYFRLFQENSKKGSRERTCLHKHEKYIWDDWFFYIVKIWQVMNFQ